MSTSLSGILFTGYNDEAIVLLLHEVVTLWETSPTPRSHCDPIKWCEGRVDLQWAHLQGCKLAHNAANSFGSIVFIPQKKNIQFHKYVPLMLTVWGTTKYKEHLWGRKQSDDRKWWKNKSYWRNSITIIMKWWIVKVVAEMGQLYSRTSY